MAKPAVATRGGWRCFSHDGEGYIAEKAADSAAGVQVLDDITRQKDKRLTDAILAIRRGDGAEGLRIMERDAGTVHEVADRTAAMEMIVKDWFEAKYPDSHEKKAGKGVEYQEKTHDCGHACRNRRNSTASLAACVAKLAN